MTKEVTMTKTVEIGEVKRIEDEDLTVLNHIQGNPVAQARIAKRLLAKGKDQGEVAQLLGVRQPWISRILKLLELPESVLKEVEDGELPATTAYLLTRLPAKQRDKLLRQETLTQQDVLDEVRKASVTPELLDLVEAPTKPTKGSCCPTCGRKY